MPKTNFINKEKNRRISPLMVNVSDVGASVPLVRQCHRPTRSVAALFLEERVQPRLGDCLINFRLGAAGRDAAKGLAVQLNGQPALVRKEIRKSQNLNIAFL